MVGAGGSLRLARCASIAMIPQKDGDATPLAKRPLCITCCLQALGFCLVIESQRAGGGRSSSLSGIVDSGVSRVADVVKSFDSVDPGVLDSVLSSLCLPAGIRHVQSEYHSHVRQRFKFACGLGWEHPHSVWPR